MPPHGGGMGVIMNNKNNRKYKKTIEWLDQVSFRELDKNQANEYHFMLGHSYFMEHDNIKARASFYQIKDGNSKYAPPALYYYSHINYIDKNYVNIIADDEFIKAESSSVAFQMFNIEQDRENAISSP